MQLKTLTLNGQSYDDFPSSNQPLTFTGAVNATYDGSEAVTVNIPSGGGGTAGEFSYVRVIAPEDVVYLTINEDAEGNPLRFTEAYIAVISARSSEATSSGNFGIGLTEWLPSFNGKAFAYSIPLNADVYMAQAYVRLNDEILETRIMQISRTVNNISAAKPFAESGAGAIGRDSVAYDQNGSARFAPANQAYGYHQWTNYPIVIDGAMHTVTIGVDGTGSIKLAAGTILEVWYR